MSAFTLDASGAVALPHKNAADQTFVSTLWSDLDPFTQGYVEALFRDASAALQAERQRRFDAFLHSKFAVCPSGDRFSDLSPSALERIVRDCGERCRLAPQWARAGASHDGCRFWEMRQRETMRMTFPPLTVSLDDAGKVTLADRVQA